MNDPSSSNPEPFTTERSPEQGLQSLASNLKNQNPPSGSEVEGLVCVHESLVVKGKAQTNNGDIWDDHGTGADQDCSIYNIIPDDDNGLIAGTFYGQRHSSSQDPNPTIPQAYCLDKSKINLIRV